MRLRRSLGRVVARLSLVALDLVAYPASILMPRSPARWVFGHTRNLLGDNPKYLFLWMALHRPDIHVTWITGSRRTRRLLRAYGYRVRRRWSPGGIAAALRAKVFVFSHHVGNVNVQLSGGALLVNLWHGVGLKTIHLGHPTGQAVTALKLASSRLGMARVREYVTPPDILVTTSEMMRAHFAGQFGLPPDRCPELGYPRLDCARDPALAAAAEALDRAGGFAMNPDGFAEVYIYMPTYRDSRRPFFERALPDLDRLSATLAERNALLYIKPHLHTALALPPGSANIQAWPRDIDVNTYLGRFTGLITDYSSVLYDYLFLKDVGAILYTFDFDEYVAGDRALNYPFEENVAGVQVATFDGLCEVLRDGVALDPSRMRGAERIRERFWGGSPPVASAAIVNYVERRHAPRPIPAGRIPT